MSSTHVFEDDCEQFPSSLRAANELFVNAQDVYPDILSTKFHSYEHVVHPPGPKTFIGDETVSVVGSLQSPGAAGPHTDQWMEELSAAEFILQFGIDPDVPVSPGSKLMIPEGASYIIDSPDSDDSSYPSDNGSDSAKESPELSGDDRSKVLRKKLRIKVKKRAEARCPGANPAYHKRDLNYAKCGLVKMWLVDTGCGYDQVFKREVALMKRFVEKCKTYNYISHRERSYCD